MKHRTEYMFFSIAAAGAFFGVLLLVAFSGVHAGCSAPMSPDVPAGLRNCAQSTLFYFSGWALIGAAVILTALGFRAKVRRDREANQLRGTSP